MLSLLYIGESLLWDAMDWLKLSELAMKTSELFLKSEFMGQLSVVYWSWDFDFVALRLFGFMTLMFPLIID